MKMVHEDNMHCGHTVLISHVRQRFWPLKAATMARSIEHHCVRCSKPKPQLLHQIMGDLPVDYCGPFWIHFKIRGKKPTKVYLAIFCCFSTKVVHMELVSDLTTYAYIRALKRFISRRDRCQNIYSGNATNIGGAKNKITELTKVINSKGTQEKIMGTCSEKGIHFHFVLPRDPHF